LRSGDVSVAAAYAASFSSSVFASRTPLLMSTFFTYCCVIEDPPWTSRFRTYVLTAPRIVPWMSTPPCS
jgi:hypothetical protein